MNQVNCLVQEENEILCFQQNPFILYLRNSSMLLNVPMLINDGHFFEIEKFLQIYSISLR